MTFFISRAIMDSLSEYHHKERVLRDSDSQLKQREAERATLTEQWDKTLGTLWNLLDQQNNQKVENRGPLLPWAFLLLSFHGLNKVRYKKYLTKRSKQSKSVWQTCLFKYTMGQSIKTGSHFFSTIFRSLSMIVEKLEIMRWLISQLVCARGKHYDWLEDPHCRLPVLALTRVHNTVDMFTQD